MACLVWGLLIVALIGSSLFVFMPLLVITAPWVGHATWRAYKGLVAQPKPDQSLTPDGLDPLFQTVDASRRLRTALVCGSNSSRVSTQPAS